MALSWPSPQRVRSVVARLDVSLTGTCRRLASLAPGVAEASLSSNVAEASNSFRLFWRWLPRTLGAIAAHRRALALLGIRSLEQQSCTVTMHMIQSRVRRCWLQMIAWQGIPHHSITVIGMAGDTPPWQGIPHHSIPWLLNTKGYPQKAQQCKYQLDGASAFINCTQLKYSCTH